MPRPSAVPLIKLEDLSCCRYNEKNPNDGTPAYRLEIETKCEWELPKDIKKDNVKSIRYFKTGKVLVTLKNGDTRNYNVTWWKPHVSLGLQEADDETPYDEELHTKAGEGFIAK